VTLHADRRRARRRLWVALGALVLASAVARGDARAQAGDPGPAWRASVALGYAYWSDLGDLDPFVGGSFDDGGWNIDLALHRRVGRLGPTEVLIGADAGFFSHGSDIRGFDEDLQSRGLYLTPSVRFAFGDPLSRRFYLEAGVGLYSVDFVEFLDCDNGFCSEELEIFEESTFGGYIGLSSEVPLRIGGAFTTGVRVHFADYGDVDELGPGAGSLSGPMFIFHVGAVFGW
jgi:hypothetical protein